MYLLSRCPASWATRIFLLIHASPLFLKINERRRPAINNLAWKFAFPAFLGRRAREEGAEGGRWINSIFQRRIKADEWNISPFPRVGIYF